MIDIKNNVKKKSCIIDSQMLRPVFSEKKENKKNQLGIIFTKLSKYHSNISK